MKKVVFGFISIMLTLSILLSGCGSANKADKDNAQGLTNEESKNAENVNPAGVFPIVKEKITLSAFIPHEAIISDYVNNDATIELEKRTNIKLTFIDVPLDGVQEKKRLLLASGDYPDIFMLGEAQSFSNEDIMLYGNSQKIFRPMNDLIDKYGFEIKKKMEIAKTLKTDMTTPDGNIYGLPIYEPTYHTTWSQKMWMNQAWLDKLNLKLPETTDELYTVLKAFKEKDPDGNGKADQIPLTGAVKWENGQPQHFIMNSFIYTNRKNFFFINNGKLDYAPSKPEWKEGIKYMNKLYKDGLFDPAAFTQTMAQVKTLATNPEGSVVGAVTTLHPGHFTVISDDPNNQLHNDYVAVAPLKGPQGAQYAAYFGGIQGAGFVITDKCKNPEAAFRLGDYFYGEEGTLLITEGLEGKTWAKAEVGQKDILGRQAKYIRIVYTHVAGASNNFNWGNSMFRNRGSEFDGLRGYFAYDQDTTKLAGYETRLFQETKNKYAGKEPKEVFTSVFLPAKETDEAFQLKVNLEDYVNQSLVRFITGDLDVEKDWDSYLKKLEDLNLKRYLEIYGKAYDDKKKLQN
ncbi:MAG TPA: extracellular solute-binding protein [Ruminiclostridium sp.]